MSSFYEFEQRYMARFMGEAKFMQQQAALEKEAQLARMNDRLFPYKNDAYRVYEETARALKRASVIAEEVAADKWRKMEQASQMRDVLGIGVGTASCWDFERIRKMAGPIVPSPTRDVGHNVMSQLKRMEAQLAKLERQTVKPEPVEVDPIEDEEPPPYDRDGVKRQPGFAPSKKND